jgi:hypothetical protein
MTVQQAMTESNATGTFAVATVDATDIDTALAGVSWDDRHETLPGVWEVFGGMDVDEDDNTDDTDAWMIRVVLGAR